MVRSLVYVSILALLSFSTAQGSKPCKYDNTTCTTYATRCQYPIFIEKSGTNLVKSSFIKGKVDNFTYELSNSSLGDFSKCKVQELKFNSDKTTINFILKCPKLILNSDYNFTTADGKNQIGHFNVSIDDTLINIVQDIKLNKKNNSTYITITQSAIKVKIHHAKFLTVQSKSNQNEANNSETYYNDKGENDTIKAADNWLQQILVKFAKALEVYVPKTPYEELFTDKPCDESSG